VIPFNVTTTFWPVGVWTTVGVGVGDGDGDGLGVGVGVGVGAATDKHAENSDVLPTESVAVQLITPLVVPVGKSNGSILNGPIPLLSVETLGIFPNCSGWEGC